VKASHSTLLCALGGLAHTALLLSLFAACGSNEDNAPLPPPGPASVEITGIALGHGFVGDGDVSSILACDYTIGVNVQLTNWQLRGPGRCGGALQCGQMRVSLLGGPDSIEPPTAVAAGNGVALDVSSLLPAITPLQALPYTIQVELVDDAGKPYIAVDGGNGSTQKQFQMAFPPPSDCANPLPGSAGAAGGGTAGAGGSAGGAGGSAGGAGDSAGGAGGSAGGAGGSAGGAGDSAGGAGGSAGGAGGSAGGAGGSTAGTAGTGG